MFVCAVQIFVAVEINSEEKEICFGSFLKSTKDKEVCRQHKKNTFYNFERRKEYKSKTKRQHYSVKNLAN